MEEILASIRRIISEDDAPDASAAAAPPSPPPEESAPRRAAADELPIPDDDELASASGGAAFADEADDELELTDKVESHGDLDVYSASAAAAETGMPAEALGALVSAPAAAAAAAAFGRLSGNIAMPAPGRTLEDVVRELLKPLLQQWLDDNLPSIVQRAVDAEVTRIARGG